MSVVQGAAGPGAQETPAREAMPPRPVGYWFEDMPFRRAHLLAAIALFMAFVIESWEQLALIYVSGDLGSAFGIDEGRIGWALSAVALGMIPGSLVWGPLSDRTGRRNVCLWSLAAYGVIALISAFSPNFTILMVTRFLSGLALAGIYTVTFPYFLELLPSRLRGRAAVYLSIGWPIGVLLAVGVTQLVGGWAGMWSPWRARWPGSGSSRSVPGCPSLRTGSRNADVMRRPPRCCAGSARLCPRVRSSPRRTPPKGGRRRWRRGG
ncbi:MFS transporter [Streptomyces sp. FXJ1.4098]|nr:MFS transporter [Streptomyces sp. FXJ1.4098]